MGEAVVAITGASGARYGVRLLDALTEAGWKTHLIVTREGALNLELECGIAPEDLASDYVVLENNNNLAAKSASGSARFDAYIVCPASGTTIGKIANGISDNLATRSALVAMKERRKLILVPRKHPMQHLISEQWQIYQNGELLFFRQARDFTTSHKHLTIWWTSLLQEYLTS